MDATFTEINVPPDFRDRPLPLWFILRAETICDEHGLNAPLGVDAWLLKEADIIDAERLHAGLPADDDTPSMRWVANLDVS